MPDDIDVRIVINVIYDMFDMYGALTYTICMYVNMGVKRSIGTSGMQPAILKIKKGFSEQKNCETHYMGEEVQIYTKF